VQDFTELYNFCYNWLKNEDYVLEEKEYVEKNPAVGKEIIIKWEAWKKISDYFKNVIKMNWHILGMNDVDIEVNGKKDKTNYSH